MRIAPRSPHATHPAAGSRSPAPAAPPRRPEGPADGHVRPAPAGREPRGGRWPPAGRARAAGPARGPRPRAPPGARPAPQPHGGHHPGRGAAALPPAPLRAVLLHRHGAHGLPVAGPPGLPHGRLRLALPLRGGRRGRGDPGGGRPPGLGAPPGRGLQPGERHHPLVAARPLGGTRRGLAAGPSAEPGGCHPDPPLPAHGGGLRGGGGAAAGGLGRLGRAGSSWPSPHPCGSCSWTAAPPPA